MQFVDSDRDISLYIHIPFCTTKCAYCAFYSLERSAVAPGEMEAFKRTLSLQLDALVEELKRPFHTIFIGGGNPGMVGFEYLHELLKTATRYGRPVECTTEMNPEFLDDGIIPLFDILTRVSVGIQSMDSGFLGILGRNADRETNIRALSLLSDCRKKYGIQFNADLMTCIPGQKIEDSLADIEAVSAYSPDHISLYSLTFEEGTKLVEKCTPMDEEEQRKLLLSCWQRLDELGYRQYEISNFARDGHECLHNKVYWSLGQYIGLGPTAESSVGYRNIVSSREADSLSQYLASPSFDSVELTAEEAEEEYLLTTLRTVYGIDKREYEKRFDRRFDERYRNFISDLDSELYVDDDAHFALTVQGFLLLDSVILSLAMAI
ncbi:MAG: coproporphyrinogen III oxidase family protein [Spirochaetales bacterium]|nr:coproporphyrinogen III oxidase family protein [Spirochaetales bacterium]